MILYRLKTTQRIPTLVPPEIPCERSFESCFYEWKVLSEFLLVDLDLPFHDECAEIIEKFRRDLERFPEFVPVFGVLVPDAQALAIHVI